MIKVTAMVFTALMAALQWVPFQKPDEQQETLAGFTEIDSSLAGETWYGALLFDKKNVGVAHEVIRVEELDGRPVYYVESHIHTELPFQDTEIVFKEYLAPDFTMVRMEFERIEVTRVPGNKQTELTRGVCEAQAGNSAKCTFENEKGEKEVKTFHAKHGPMVSASSASLLARVLAGSDLKKFTSHTVDIVDRSLEKNALFPGGDKRIYHNGVGYDARLMRLLVAPDDIEEQFYISDQGGLLMSRLIIKQDRRVEILFHPGTEEQAHRDPFVPAVKVPPDERNPRQVFSAYMAFAALGDTDAALQCFDVKRIHDHLVRKFPVLVPGEPGQWEGFTRDFLNRILPGNNEGVDVAVLTEYMEFEELFVEQRTKLDIKGDRAMLTIPDLGDITFSMNHTDQGWKIDWIDIPEEFIEQLLETMQGAPK